MPRIIYSKLLLDSAQASLSFYIPYSSRAGNILVRGAAASRLILVPRELLLLVLMARVLSVVALTC